MSMIRAGAGILALAVVLGGLAVPADAGGRDRGDRRDVHRHVVHRPPPPPAWGYAAPSYVQAPPPVVYAPPAPPPVVFPAPGLSLNFNIR